MRVFHRNGKPMGDFRKVWAKACESAGVSGKLVHDLRRTAARDFRRAVYQKARSCACADGKLVICLIGTTLLTQRTCPMRSLNAATANKRQTFQSQHISPVS